MFFKESSMTMEEFEKEAPITIRNPPCQEYAVGQKVIVTSVLAGCKEEQAEIVKVLGPKVFDNNSLFMLVFEDGRKTYRRSDRIRAVRAEDKPLELNLSSEEFEDEYIEVKDEELEEVLPPTIKNPPARPLYSIGSRVMACRHSPKSGEMERGMIMELTQNPKSSKIIAHVKFSSGGSTYRFVEDLSLMAE